MCKQNSPPGCLVATEVKVLVNELNMITKFNVKQQPVISCCLIKLRVKSCFRRPMVRESKLSHVGRNFYNDFFLKLIWIKSTHAVPLPNVMNFNSTTYYEKDNKKIAGK